MSLSPLPISTKLGLVASRDKMRVFEHQLDLSGLGYKGAADKGDPNQKSKLNYLK